MISTLQNDSLIRALLRQPVLRTPVWVMRQAGRYLPEYRQLRQQAKSFMQFCKTPELTTQAALQPLARFDLDAAIVFSDILTVPEAMGLSLEFESGQGPVIHNPITSLHDVRVLKTDDVAKSLHYVMQAVSQLREALQNKIPLIGFAGSPWTIATYMVEGGSSKAFCKIKTMAYADAKTLHLLLQTLTHTLIDYLNAQIEAGAQVIMLFDSWGGVLSYDAYQQFSLSYLSQIAQKIKRQVNGQPVPLIFFTKQAGAFLELIAQSGCDAVGLDSSVNIADAKQRIGHQVALQGNLDPFELFGAEVAIRASVKKILDNFQGEAGHIFNLGHGVDQNTPIDHVKVMVDYVHQYSCEWVA